jgi:hypothetical protein
VGPTRTIFHITISGASANAATSFTTQSGGALVSTNNTVSLSGTDTGVSATSGANSVCLVGDGSTYLASAGLGGTLSFLPAGGSSYLTMVPLSFGTCTGVMASVHATTNVPTTQVEGYRELSETLSELSNIQDDEWHIESEVYDTSIQVAAALLDKNIPTPHVFSHGPKSVVFNWGDGENNLYLTIGKCRLWATVSSASELKARVELTGPTNNVTGDFLKALGQTLSNRHMLGHNPLSEAS